ncbi:MAG: FeoB small GTPase domain-containing protein [Planctomycetota bacterium]|jgi:ferrous iron transport protein B
MFQLTKKNKTKSLRRDKPKTVPPALALVGNPNVGKSVIFGLLTGKYVIVSNYPGTTVTVSRGTCKRIGNGMEIIDTPGVNSLIPQSEDERVARDILLEGNRKVIQVLDSKNLRRGLLITTQLAEMELPVVLDLNMWDECLERGIDINTDRLQDILGVQLVKTVATEKRGIGELLSSVPKAKRLGLRINYGQEIEDTVDKMEALLPEGLPKRAISLMLLSGDLSLEKRLNKQLGKEAVAEIKDIREALQGKFADPLSYVITKKRGAFVDRIVREVVKAPTKRAQSNPFLRGLFFFFIMPLLSFAIGYKTLDLVQFLFSRQFTPPLIMNLSLDLAGGTALCVFTCIHLYKKELRTKRTISEVLGNLTMHPALAYPILIVILWVVYKLVGQFGAGDAVDFFESKLFGQAGEPSGGFDLWVGVPFSSISYTITHVPFQGVNYYLGAAARMVMSPENIVYRFFLGSHAGIIQVAVTYSIAIVLPIVSFFFLAFGLMEDSGYLPRLAIMIDRLFKKIGLTGKAILPMVLGLGCVTMATLTTRILDKRKERLIVILLLALAIPCSAQLGVIAFILGSISGLYFLIYVFVIVSQLLMVGFVASKVLPGGRSDFIIEIPPFRFPKILNIIVKTLYRLKWFLKEAVPLFILGTLILFVLTEVGVLKYIINAGGHVVGLLGLPKETSEGFLLGFLRRDFGAVSIFKTLEDNKGAAGVDPLQLLVALVVITLFVPCIANFFVMIKEVGIVRSILIVLFIIPYAFLVGGILNLIMRAV